MKKIIVLYLLLSTSLLALDERDYLIYQGEFLYYNTVYKDYMKQDFKIIYNDNSELFFNVTDVINDAWLYLDTETIKYLLVSIEKYKQWEKLAIKNNIKITKKIPDLDITSSMALECCNKWVYNNIKISFIFHSEDEKNHKLVIYFNNIKDDNSIFDYSFEEMYFDKMQVEKLKRVLQADNLNREIEKIQEVIKNKELFN